MAPGALRALLSDERESVPLLSTGLQLFCLSFVALFLELMFIRWVPSVIILVSYYANLMLISSFLGLGIGMLLRDSRLPLFRGFPLLLLLDIAMLLLLRRVPLAGTATELRFFAPHSHVIQYLTLVVIFLLNVGVFAALGHRIGALFDRLPALRAYACDLGGSLAGTVAFGLFSFAHFSPLAGIVLVALLYLLLVPTRSRWMSAPFLAAALLLVALGRQPMTFWSPYYSITVKPASASVKPGPPPAQFRTLPNPPVYIVAVNHNFYQYDGTLDLRRYSPVPPALEQLSYDYRIPSLLRPRAERVLVVGAGGGLDVESALLGGAQFVDAVEIDPMLVRLSRRFNASAVYDDPRVRVHLEDARSFFQRQGEPYDLIIFGLLDSQALFSTMSNVRLDGFVYTVESLRSAYRRLKPDGVLTISFAVGERRWLASKMHRMLETATGQRPLVYRRPGGNMVFCVGRSGTPTGPEQVGTYRATAFELDPVPLATDDWPYLYLSKKTIPADYAIVIGVLLLLSVLAFAFLRAAPLNAAGGHFFLLGWAFLLLETKSIIDGSLYFGATWFVTLLVVSGVLLMVLLANLCAARFTLRPRPVYAALLLWLLVLYAMPQSQVLGWSLTGRLLWMLMAVPLPVFFAGLIFSSSFKRVAVPSPLLGANLVGATFGGFSEYLGMSIGYRGLSWILIAVYATSLLCLLRWDRSERPA